MKRESIKSKLSTRKLYVIALVLLVLGFGLRLGVRLKAAYSSCGLVCEDSDFFGNVIAPIGTIIFVLGLALMITATVRYLMLRRKR